MSFRPSTLCSLYISRECSSGSVAIATSTLVASKTFTFIENKNKQIDNSQAGEQESIYLPPLHSRAGTRELDSYSTAAAAAAARRLAQHPVKLEPLPVREAADHANPALVLLVQQLFGHADDVSDLLIGELAIFGWFDIQLEGYAVRRGGVLVRKERKIRLAVVEGGVGVRHRVGVGGKFEILRNRDDAT